MIIDITFITLSISAFSFIKSGNVKFYQCVPISLHHVNKCPERRAKLLGIYYLFFSYILLTNGAYNICGNM